MPKNKFSNKNKRKSYNKNNKKSFDNKRSFKRKDNQDDDHNKFKKFKHIQRNKLAEDTLRRQQQVELKYQNKKKIQEEYLHSDDEEETVDPFQALLATFEDTKNEKSGKKSAAIESSDSEEEEESSSESKSSEDPFDDDEDLDSESDEDLDKDHPVKKQKTESSNLSGNDEQEEVMEESEEEVESEDSEVEEEDSDDELIIENTTEDDSFSSHLDNDLNVDLLESVTCKPQNVMSTDLNWPELGMLKIDIPKSKKDHTVTSITKKKSLISLDDEEKFASEGTIPKRIDYKQIDLKKLAIKVQIEKNVTNANAKNLVKFSDSKIFTPLQAELFSIMNNYQDLYYPNRTLSNSEEIRFIYCLHAINHILKTRTKIIHHNTRLGKLALDKKSTIIPDQYRDQGLVRPKVLIVVPFRDSAYRVINYLIKLLIPEKDGNIMNHSRFVEEFTGESIVFPVKNPKPEDYEQTFAGNTDDSFRIGISFTKKCIKLYSEFYSSDILVTSPLGLRLIIGAVGEKDRDYDFLASIEMLILDQSELFLAQNWDHLLHILDHLHLQPQTVRNTDFARVRSWSLNGWSRFYRQTIFTSSHELPEFRSLFNNRCLNYRGKARITNPIVGGTIKKVIMQIPQIFNKIDVTSMDASFDARFNYFVSTVLPQYKNPSMAHCLIYVPSYFDYVRLRNYLKKESVNYVQICEYTKDEKIARARDMFFHSSAHFLLYSERAHFFRRTRIKGIRHIIFYQPPNWPEFYTEMVNLMQEANQNKRDSGTDNMTVTVLYTKYDIIQLSGIVGTEKADNMKTSVKTMHMFMTSD